MKLLSKAEMEKLTTKRLLAYKSKLLKTPDTYCWLKDGVCPCCDRGEFIKSNPAWQEIYNNVKAVLATREHVDRK